MRISKTRMLAFSSVVLLLNSMHRLGISVQMIMVQHNAPYKLLHTVPISSHLVLFLFGFNHKYNLQYREMS